MTNAAISRHDARITVSDPAGIQARMTLLGVTTFELAKLGLPVLTHATSDTAGPGCGGCASAD